MDSFKKAKKLIKGAKNIYILPSKDFLSESIPTSLALFYSLRKLQKNVNLIVEEVPQRFHFLVPSLGFISYPKDFVLSFPSSKAEISQIRYEKNEENLKIYLTLDKGNFKKTDVSFSFANFNPDLLITVGIKNQDYFKEFFPENPKILSDLAVLNINQTGGKNFGQVNLIESSCSLAEIVTSFLKTIDNNLIDKNIATCLLTSVILSSENFKNQKTSTETFETAAFLTKRGALHQQIIDYLYKSQSLSPTQKVASGEPRPNEQEVHQGREVKFLGKTQKNV